MLLTRYLTIISSQVFSGHIYWSGESTGGEHTIKGWWVVSRGSNKPFLDLLNVPALQLFWFVSFSWKSLSIHSIPPLFPPPSSFSSSSSLSSNAPSSPPPPSLLIADYCWNKTNASFHNFPFACNDNISTVGINSPLRSSINNLKENLAILIKVNLANRNTAAVAKSTVSCFLWQNNSVGPVNNWFGVRCSGS